MEICCVSTNTSIYCRTRKICLYISILTLKMLMNNVIMITFSVMMESEVGGILERCYLHLTSLSDSKDVGKFDLNYFEVRTAHLLRLEIISVNDTSICSVISLLAISRSSFFADASFGLLLGAACLRPCFPVCPIVC